jgi:hypothetical protein
LCVFFLEEEEEDMEIIAARSAEADVVEAAVEVEALDVEEAEVSWLDRIFFSPFHFLNEFFRKP